MTPVLVRRAPRAVLDDVTVMERRSSIAVTAAPSPSSLSQSSTGSDACGDGGQASYIIVAPFNRAVSTSTRVTRARTYASTTEPFIDSAPKS